MEQLQEDCSDGETTSGSSPGLWSRHHQTQMRTVWCECQNLLPLVRERFDMMSRCSQTMNLSIYILSVPRWHTGLQRFSSTPLGWQPLGRPPPNSSTPAPHSFPSLPFYVKLFLVSQYFSFPLEATSLGCILKTWPIHRHLLFFDVFKCFNVLFSWFSYLQIKQHEFREDFRKTAPFQFDSTNYYDRLDRVSDKSLFSKVSLLEVGWFFFRNGSLCLQSW